MTKDESQSLVKLLGALFASALVTALGAGALAAPRLQGSSLVLSWLVLSAAFALPALVICALSRLAAASLGEAQSPQFRPILIALVLSAATVFVFALALGRVLRSNTHHTGLAGTTFAVVCAVVALGIAPLWMRLASSMRSWRPTAQTALLAAAAAAAVALFGMALFRVQAAIGNGELDFGAAAFADLGALLVLGIVISSARIGRMRIVSMLALPLFVALMLLGVSLTRSHPDLSTALAERAVLAARCSAWMVR